jgi:hypothetical protein
MNKMLHQSKRFFKQNGSAILTCVGAVGVVVTAVMTAKATPKATRLLELAEEEKGEDLTKLESIKVAGPVYIPAMVVGTATITCIFGANVLSKRQQASLVSAYALLDSSYKDYKKKVDELYGEEADVRVREEIAKDKYNDSNIEFEDEELFYDEFSGRYFNSTMAEVIQAEYDLNRQIALNGGAYLNEFYEFLDIPPIPAGMELGWSTSLLESHHWTSWLDFDHEKVVMDDGLECYIVKMRYEPMIDYAYY